MSKPTPKVAMLTAGGLAPCLSSAIGGLIERYTDLAPDIEIIGYLGGYLGLLKGESVAVTAQVRKQAGVLHRQGGSPLGNSRVKLTNAADCLKRGLIRAGENPLAVAAHQLRKAGITILHTIGGDDTNLTAGELSKYLKANGYDLTVVGLPKTIDNDVYPIRQSLGAWTAAEQGAAFFENVVNEQSANPRMLIIHEVMGRHCGWLTATTARVYRERLRHMEFVPGFNLDRPHLDIDAVYIPELAIDIASEAQRLRHMLDRKGSINIFVSEGACVEQIVSEMEAANQTIERDAFGHVKLDKVNVGSWFSKQFSKLIGAEKTLVQKSGYFSRAAPANAEDLRLIKSMVDLAVDSALDGISGVIGHDEQRQNILRAIEFERIAGGKPFDTTQAWFDEMLKGIGQPSGALAKSCHG